MKTFLLACWCVCEGIGQIVGGIFIPGIVLASTFLFFKIQARLPADQKIMGELLFAMFAVIVLTFAIAYYRKDYRS